MNTLALSHLHLIFTPWLWVTYLRFTFLGKVILDIEGAAGISKRRIDIADTPLPPRIYVQNKLHAQGLTVSVVIYTSMPDALLWLKSVCVFCSIYRYGIMLGIQMYDMFFFALKTKVLVTNVTKCPSNVWYQDTTSTIKTIMEHVS